MSSLNYIEELFLRANEAINGNKNNDAKLLLEEILSIDPTFGRAYNFLGWLHANIFVDYPKAERFYKLGIKYAGDYPATYINYIYLLIDMRRYYDAHAVIAQAGDVNGIDKSILTYQKARICEFKLDFKNAVKFYKSAKRQTVDTSFMDYLDKEIKRVKRKNGLIFKLLF